MRAARLRGTEVEPDEVPLAIDELPLVALLGAFAEGTTIVHGAEELRRKESDRVATVVEGLRGLGARIEAAPDGFVVAGGGELHGGTIDARGDHRIAMLGAVAGIVSRTGVEVRGLRGRRRSRTPVRRRSARPRAVPAMTAGGARTPQIGASSNRSTAAAACSRWSWASCCSSLLVRGCSALVRRRRRGGGERGRGPARAAARRAADPAPSRVVAYYGAPQDPELGVLGETPPEEAATQAGAARGEYRARRARCCPHSS